VAEFPVEHRNSHAPHFPYTPWHVLEHMRISQWDIVEFIRNPDHASPPWPEGHWPPRDQEADVAQWQATIQAFQADRRALIAMVEDPDTDLYRPIPHAQEYNILREVLIVADHAAYHLGVLIGLKRVLGG
jgi:hypothetical protein